MATSAYEKLDRPVDSDDPVSDSEQLRTPRSSEDARRHDQETLNAEDEAERLLGRAEKRTSPRRQKKNRRRRRDGEKVEESELMYAMEEGGRTSESSSGNSSEIDLQRLRQVQGRKA